MTDAAAVTALREGAAVCRHDLRFVARATGGDVLPWLERIASRPVADLASGTSVRATLMDGKGKLRADLRVLSPGAPAEGLLLDLPTAAHDAILRVLEMYVIKDDVNLTDLAGEQVLVTVAGPGAAAALSAAGLPQPEGDALTVIDDVLVAVSDLAGVEAFDLIGPGAAVDAAAERLLAAGAVEVDVTALDVVRVASGTPWFHRDLVDGVIPLEALLDAKVSSTKGCYPGQEVIARIVNLGQVSRRLVRLSTPGAVTLEPGASLTGTGDREGKPAGTLTWAVHDPVRDETLALGYAKRAAWTTGSVVKAGDVELSVTSLSD